MGPVGAQPFFIARDPEKIMETFGNLIDLFVTEGYKTPASASTLLNLLGGSPAILREGAIARSEFSSIIEP